MTLHLKLTMNNDAFDDNEGPETARILRKLADTFDNWPGANRFTLGLRDINGNKVGEAHVEED